MGIRSLIKKLFIYILVFFVVISAITFLRIQNIDLLTNLTSQQYGYLVPYVFAFLSSLSFYLLIPIPSFAPIFVDAGLSHTFVVGSFILGELTASVILVILAILFREKFLNNNQKYISFYEKIHRKFPRIPYLIAFLLFLFTPNEITLVIMVLLGFKLRYLLPILIVANTLYNFTISHVATSFVDLLSSLFS